MHMATNMLVPKRRSSASRILAARPSGGSERRVGDVRRTGDARPGTPIDTLSETDRHLRRSYALVERLLREVAARSANIT